MRPESRHTHTRPCSRLDRGVRPIHTTFKPGSKMHSNSCMWPQAGPAFLASLFSSVKWDFRPKALGDLVHPQGRIISRKLSLVFGWLLLSGPPPPPRCAQGWRGTRVRDSGWKSSANPDFLQETETEQRWSLPGRGEGWGGEIPEAT